MPSPSPPPSSSPSGIAPQLTSSPAPPFRANSYLDRNALANARVQRIEDDLEIVGTGFNTAISVFFVGYLTLQIPSNVVLTRLRPSVYLPVCMVFWGLFAGLTSVTYDYTSLMVVRFFLGVCEAPFFPGALFLLSSWYTRRELAMRTAILYSGGLLAGGFGGLVAAYVQDHFDGWHDLPAWRWVFALESAVTVVVAPCAWLVLPDFPATTRWLSREERALAAHRLRRLDGFDDAAQASLWSGVLKAVTDYKVWLLTVIIFTKTSAATVTSFIPTLISTFNYTPTATLELVAPPYAFAALVSLAVSFSSDRCSERSYHIIVSMACATVGYLVTGLTLNVVLRYGALWLMLGGVYGSYNVALAWISSTLPRPVEKRAAAIALVNTIGNAAQICAPYLYREESRPAYFGAMMANCGFCLACIGVTLLLRSRLKRENRRLQQKESRTAVPSAGDEVREHIELQARRRTKDAEPSFRYNL